MPLGLDLTNAPVRYLTGIGPAGYRVRYATVRLRLTDGVDFRDWPATVGFTDAPLPLDTLGHAGCLQFFTAIFRGDTGEVRTRGQPVVPRHLSPVNVVDRHAEVQYQLVETSPRPRSHP